MYKRGGGLCPVIYRGEIVITAPAVSQVFSILLHTGKSLDVLWNNWVYTYKQWTQMFGLLGWG